MISTSLKILDEHLGGGIKNGIITDIYGATGTGKTQLVMQICLNSLRQDGNVLFQDTTGHFRPERMFDLIKTYNLDDKVLESIKVARVTNTGEQIKYLSKIQQNDFSLVIIDNITDLFSFEFPKDEQNLEKNTTFMQYMRDLSFLAIEKKIPIIITNMIRKIDDIEKENMEKSISMFTHVKIKLTKQGTKYFGEVFPSFVKKKKFLYQITKEGLIETA